MQLLRLHDNDNVAVALLPLVPGVVADGVEVRDEIPAMHKVAVRPIGKGDTVTRYRRPIGVATADIAAAAHVHNHNCGMTHSRQEAEAGSRLIQTGFVAYAETVAECGARIFGEILEVASGRETSSEELDYGNNEFTPWQLGAVY
jgi:altronate dehydratase